MRHSNLAICCLTVQCLRGQQTHFSCKKGCILCKTLALSCPAGQQPCGQSHSLSLPSWKSPWHSSSAAPFLFLPLSPRTSFSPQRACSPHYFLQESWGTWWRRISHACHGVGWQNSPKGIVTMVLSDNTDQQHWKKNEFCRTKPNLFCSPAKMDLLHISYPTLISHLSSN